MSEIGLMLPRKVVGYFLEGANMWYFTKYPALAPSQKVTDFWGASGALNRKYHMFAPPEM